MTDQRDGAFIHVKSLPQAYRRIIQAPQTIAYLANVGTVSSEHIAQAILYRRGVHEQGCSINRESVFLSVYSGCKVLF